VTYRFTCADRQHYSVIKFRTLICGVASILFIGGWPTGPFAGAGSGIRLRQACEMRKPVRKKSQNCGRSKEQFALTPDTGYKPGGLNWPMPGQRPQVARPLCQIRRQAPYHVSPPARCDLRVSITFNALPEANLPKIPCTPLAALVSQVISPPARELRGYRRNGAERAEPPCAQASTGQTSL